MDYMIDEFKAFPVAGHQSVEWEEILKYVSASAIKCTVPIFSDSFPLLHL